MKKKIIGIVIFFVLLVGLFSTAYAGVEFVNCNILKVSVASGALVEGVIIKTVTPEGETVNYTCAEKIRINGVSYRYEEDIINAIPAGVFGKIAVEDDVVRVINYSTESKVYENVTYNPRKKAFNIKDVKNSGLSVYYRYNGDLYPAKPDGNHYYDIEVYEYGILITDMKSKTMPEDIKLIEPGVGIDSDFLQYVAVYCETTAVGNCRLIGELYDGNMNLISGQETECSDMGELQFTGLNNTSAKYIVKLWLESDGTPISDKYIVKCETHGFDTPSGYIIQKNIIDSALESVLKIKVIDENGIEKTYICGERVWVNGTRYKTPDELESAIGTNVFAKMAIEDGKITRINFGEDSDSFKDATYNESAEKFDISQLYVSGLPIYYQYNDDFYPGYLDENHYYDIEVYEYGILITDMKSKTMPEDIKLIEPGVGIDSEFFQNVGVYCETTATMNCSLIGELYDSNMNLICSQETECSDMGELQFTGLKNLPAEYLVKLWLENDGTPISDKYIVKCEAHGFDTPSGYITQKRITDSALETGIIIKAVDLKGEIKTYSCSDRMRVNGRRYKTLEELAEAISTGTFVKMAIEDGKVVVLNFDEFYNQYPDASYNQTTKCFEGLTEKEQNLPVYYRYNDDFYPAYPDENHYYNIEVYEYGILITDMKSKTMPKDIKLIEIGTGIDAEFSQFINVYCETTSTESVVLKGELYGNRNKKLSKSRGICADSGEISFKIPVNAGTPTGISLWLEDENGKQISDIYTLGTGKKQKKIVFGDILMIYTADEDGEEKIHISVKGVNGGEEVFVCDSDVIVLNDISYYSLRTTVAIPESSFAKIGVEDGIAKVIKLGGDSVEMSVSDFVLSENQPEAGICIMNNTADSVPFDCYAAIYGESGELKGVNVTHGTVGQNENTYVAPVFENYKYSDGDYAKVFLWEPSDMSAIIDSVEAAIINQ